MLVKLKKEYLADWLKRLATVDLGTAMHDICKAVYMRLDGDILTLIRTGNSRSFAIIRTNEIEEIVEAEEPVEVLIHSDRLSTLMDRLSDGILRIGVPTNFDFNIEKGGFKGSWKQKLGKDNFPQQKAFSFISKILELESGMFKTIDSKKFVEAVKKIKYMRLKPSFNPKLKNVVFNNGSCWAVDYSRYHEIELNDFPYMDLVIPRESLSVADFIHLSGVDEFKFYEGESHYFFVVGDDYFIMEKNGFVAEEEKKSFVSKYNKPGFVKFNLSSKKFLEAVERIGITANGSTSIAITCLDNKIVLESKDKLDNCSKEVIPVALSGDMPRKLIKWDSLTKPLNSVCPLDVEVRFNDKSMVIKTDKDKIVLSFVGGKE